MSVFLSDLDQSGATTAQVITWDGTQWIPGNPPIPVLTTKGDLLTFDTAPNRLPAGNTGQVLRADSSTSSGLAWVNPASGTSGAIQVNEAGQPFGDAANFSYDSTNFRLGLRTQQPSATLTIANNLSTGEFPVQIIPAETAAKNFNFALAGFSNQAVGTPRLNQVLRFGWNMGLGGGLADPTDAAMGLEFEGHYQPDANNNYFEYHFAYYSLNGGKVFRPFSYQINKITDIIGLSFQIDHFSFLRPSDQAEWMKFQPYQISLNGTTTVKQGTNNQPWLFQANAAGTGAVELLRVNSNDTVDVGGGNPVRVVGSLNVLGPVTFSHDLIGGKANLAASTSPGQVPYTAGGVLSIDNANTLVQDSVNHRVGVGTNVPNYKLTVSGPQNANDIVCYNPTVSGVFFFSINDYYGQLGTKSNHPVAWIVNNSEVGRFFQNGDCVIGRSSDGNFRFDVQKSGSAGTARFVDSTATTGITRVRVQEGAGQASNEVFGIYGSNGTSKRLSVTPSAIELAVTPKFSANNVSGTGTAGLGSNCPAATPAGPYTWITATAADGSTVYIPCWK